VFVGKPIQDVEKITLDPYGMTALIDAWCLTIDKTGQRLANMREEDRPSKVMFVVITDGEENDSEEFTHDQLKERIKTQEETYNWKFEYMGANQVSAQVAHNLGMRHGRTMTYDATSIGVMCMAGEFVHSVNDFRCNNYTPGDFTNDQKDK